MTRWDPARFWQELQRRRVVRSAFYYVAGAWVLAQATSLVLDAFDEAHYMRYVIWALVLGLPVAVLLAWVFDLTPGGIERTQPLPEAASPTPPVPGAPERSIAVLPFANLSLDADNEYFSDGLAEEIRNRLARVPGLRVAARTSSFAFKGRHEDAREIGRRLNVATLLEGGVRRQADTVRIDLQLVSAADGYQVWSQSFERRLDDIFRLQSEVAAAVLAAVAPRGSRDEGPVMLATTSNVEAYNLYLLGRHHFHRRTDTALRRAVDYFRQAIALDGNYALAYAGLADAYTLLSASHYGSLSPGETRSLALPAALRAVELAPELAEAHASLGLIHYDQGDLPAAQAEFERALALNPGYSMAHVWLGLALNAQGRFREAAARNREAYRVDPLSPIVNTNVGFDSLRFGDEAEAEARFRAAIEVDPTFPVPYSAMFKVCSLRGRLDEARRWIDQAIERAPTRSFYLGRKGLLQLQTGDAESAADTIEAARRMSPDYPYVADIVVAMALVKQDRGALERIADGLAGPAYGAQQRAAARLALGAPDNALALYEQKPPEPAHAIEDAMNDGWVWRLPHVVTHAGLRMRAGDARGAQSLERLLEQIERLRAEGIVIAETLYWAACAHEVLGRREAALQQLREASERGWQNRWWATIDWNLRELVRDERAGGALTPPAMGDPR